MNRFVQTYCDSDKSLNEHNYIDYPLLPLMIALESFLSTINRLYHRIELSKDCRHKSSAYNLTEDESAAIYLYTEEEDEESLHILLNKALQSRNQLIIEPWYGYLKLFNTALEKLPTIIGEVWCGISNDIMRKLQENQDIIGNTVSSCSLSIDIIKHCLDENAILCSITAVNGKHIRCYTRYSKENEVLLLPGTRLHVKTIGYDSSINHHVIRLVEIDNSNHDESVSTQNSISSANNSSQDSSGMCIS